MILNIVRTKNRSRAKNVTTGSRPPTSTHGCQVMIIGKIEHTSATFISTAQSKPLVFVSLFSLARSHHSSVDALQAERDIALDPANVDAAAFFKCACKTFCSTRSSMTPAKCAAERLALLKFPLHGKGFTRRKALAAKLRETRTETLTTHPAEFALGKRKEGSRKKNQHFVLNNVDVCEVYYSKVLNISPHLLSTAAALASAEETLDLSTESSKYGKQYVSFERDFAVNWVIEWSISSGAEMLPLGDTPGLFSAEQALKSSNSAEVDACHDKLCVIRLHEFEMSQLYFMYAEDSKLKVGTLGLATFTDLFKNDPRLANIKLSRKKNGFGECTTCAENKIILSNAKTTPEERAKARRLYGQHIKLNHAERSKYVRRCSRPTVDRSQENSIPPVIIIMIAVSLIIDKMTKHTTALPALTPMPKCVTNRLNVTITGLNVHGVAFFCCKSFDSQSGGSNLTIECIDRCLRCLQSFGYVFAPKLFVQGDNHTDNKTPVVLFYLADLARKEIFHKVKLSMLIVGHGHVDVDQKFAVLSRMIKRRAALVISPSRLDRAMKEAFRQASMKPILLTVDYVHDWAKYFAGPMAVVNLGRLACSEGSDNAQHSYTFKKNDLGHVCLVYKRFSAHQERYPRQYNLNSEFIGDFGPGIVVGSEYIPSTRSWKSEVAFHNGEHAFMTHPVLGIEMFPDSTMLPCGLPGYEPMQPKWPVILANSEKNIKKCETELTVFASVSSEWAEFYARQKAQIAAVEETPGSSWYQGGGLPELNRSTHDTLTATVSAAASAATSDMPPTFQVDPVTHASFSESERVRLLSGRHLHPNLLPGGLVLIRLRFGTATPTTHVLPVCIGRIPESINLSDSGALIEFGALFTKKSDLTGTWAVGDGQLSVIKAPKFSILLSNLELTGALKLSAASLASIRSLVPSFELG